MIHSRIPAFYTEIKLTLFVFGINLGISSGFLILGYIPTSVFRIRYPVLGAHSALCRAFPRCWMKKRLLYLHPARARNCSVSCPLGPSSCKWPVTWGEEEIRAWVSSVGKTWFNCKLWKVLQLWMTWVSFKSSSNTRVSFFLLGKTKVPNARSTVSFVLSFAGKDLESPSKEPQMRNRPLQYSPIVWLGKRSLVFQPYNEELAYIPKSRELGNPTLPSPSENKQQYP